MYRVQSVGKNDIKQLENYLKFSVILPEWVVQSERGTCCWNRQRRIWRCFRLECVPIV